MAFSEETKVAALERCGGRCECTNPHCSQHYMARCASRVSHATATFHRKKDHPLTGADSASNCIVLCFDCNHQAELDELSPEYI